MRLICLSDTHQKHKQIEVPDGDLLVHAGDFSAMGHHKPVINFFEWLINQPHKYKIVIAGNHDLSFERDLAFKKTIMQRFKHRPSQNLTNLYYLEHQSLKLEGIKFFGSPYSPEFCNWAFGYDRKNANSVWTKIPQKTDIVITHGPPRDILDKCKYDNPPYPSNAGCDILATKIFKVKPTFHIFGHIHEEYGIKQIPGFKTWFVNASICNLEYMPVNEPIVFDLDQFL